MITRLGTIPLMVAALAGAQYSINPGTPYPATDALGRRVPVAAECGAPKPDRFVGMFYFLWAGQHDHSNAGPFVVDRIMREFPDALQRPTSPPWGPLGNPHYWGEPLYGFYLNSDPWVLRRHAQLLSDAGVDVIIFDTTNRITYRDVYMQLLKVFRQIRGEGGRTPQVAFMLNTEAQATAQELYEELYQPRLYEELWFRWKGKPLMVCDPEKASPEVRAFFTLRRAHWPFTQVNTDNAWHWEAAYPQVFGYSGDPAKPEQVNVSVAQNLRASDGKVTDMSRGDARGRSFHDGKLDTSEGAVNHGFNFAEQWKRALELDPPFVMVTGWNEWIAGRFVRNGKDVVFVDQFTQEFSRDIEMMRGGHGDNYYYQLVANVRRYKGAPAVRRASGPKGIRIEDGFHQWRDVFPNFLDHTGETEPRDFEGVAGLRYTNRTGRNDFELMKVARDQRNIHFYARTRQPITMPEGDCWMMLLVDADSNATTGWQGYDYRVHRGALEKNSGGWNWNKVADVQFRAEGNQMHIAVPRAALGLAAGDVKFDFKWADNLQRPADVMDFYVSGDVAPEGRFNYRFSTK